MGKRRGKQGREEEGEGVGEKKNRSARENDSWTWEKCGASVISSYQNNNNNNNNISYYLQQVSSKQGQSQISDEFQWRDLFARRIEILIRLSESRTISLSKTIIISLLRIHFCQDTECLPYT